LPIFSNIGGREISRLTVKRIGPIDQNLIFPLRKTCKCLRRVVPRHGKKYHFASRCLFLGGSHCSRTKLIDNFSQAVRASAVAKLTLWPAFNARFANAWAKAPAPMVPISISCPF